MRVSWAIALGEFGRIISGHARNPFKPEARIQNSGPQLVNSIPCLMVNYDAWINRTRATTHHQLSKGVKPIVVMFVLDCCQRAAITLNDR